MSGWILHVIATAPIFLGALMVADFPGWITFVVKLPSTAVSVCGAVSAFLTVIVSPGSTVSCPVNSKFMMTTVAWGALASGVLSTVSASARVPLVSSPTPSSPATTRADARQPRVCRDLIQTPWLNG